MGLCPARGHGTPARPDPAHVCAAWADPAYDHLWLWHLVRRGASLLRRAGSGPLTREPCLPGAICRLALLPRAATHGALHRDGAPAPERYAAHRHRDPARFWPRSAAWAPTRSRHLA